MFTPGGKARRVHALLVIFAMWQREMRELLTTSRLWVTAVLTVSLMLISALSGAARYEAEMAEYSRLLVEQEEALAGQTLARFLDEPFAVVKPPWKLAFLGNGRQRWTPDLYLSNFDVYGVPQIGRLHGAEIERQTFDWIFVIKVILSIAAFALGYDVICGRHQRAILAVVLSYAVRRWQVVIAKWLAVWFWVVVPFFVGAMLGLGALSLRGDLQLSVDELMACALTVCVGFWASAFFAAMAVWVSLWARDATRSLAVLALLWITTVVAIPGAGSLLAQTVLPLQTDRETSQALAEARSKVEGESEGPGRLLREPGLAASDGFSAERETLEMQNEVYVQQEEVRQQQIRGELVQVDLAHDLAVVSPMFLIQDLAERLIGTGLARDRDFVDQARDFGESLAEKVIEIDGLDTESPHLWQDLAPDSDAINLRQLPRYTSQRILEPGSLPVFEFRERSLQQGLVASGSRVALLVLFSLVLIVLMRNGYRKLDIGSPRPGGRL